MFEGQVSIKCTARQSLKDFAITLHAVEVQVIEASIRKDDTTVAAIEFRYDFRQQTCQLVFDECAGDFFQKDKEYVLTMDFAGILNDQMRGFYRSAYHALDGSTKTMATTQFEATDARRAFPCFDEPALKATFCLTLTIPGHLQCISNTPMAASSSHYANGVYTKTVKYQTTPLMSTYLLCFVIGEFDAISSTSRQIVTTVYTMPGKASQGQFCLELAVRCLDYFQDLFGVPYPLVKSDLIAITDFAAGAMENWGLVTYREAKVLVQGKLVRIRWLFGSYCTGT
jgi:aminopeptidase N